jgi:hypothetical protein
VAYIALAILPECFFFEAPPDRWSAGVSTTTSINDT